MASSRHHRILSDDSFEAFDAILEEELARMSALSEENAHLREMLSERDTPAQVMPGSPAIPPAAAQADAVKLKADLAAARKVQADMARELELLRASQATVVTAVVEDHTSEVSLLRSSLAALASELQAEKDRVAEVERLRKEEEDKVHTLRSKVEESRRALMRLQGESSRRSSVDFSTLSRGSLSLEPSPRRSSLNSDTVSRRKSSLGLPSTSLAGLGFATDSMLTSWSPPQTSAFGRLPQRRASANISIGPHKEDEDDRLASLRDLRLGLTSSSVTRSSSGGGNDAESQFGPEKRRSSSFSKPSLAVHRSSISEEDESIASPPSTQLRLQGRKQSTAVFENVRGGSVEYVGGLEMASRPPVIPLGSPFQARSRSVGPKVVKSASVDLKIQLEGLRIQLAESEEGRRASELCLKALKEYISASPSVEGGEPRLCLPPLPTEAEPTSPKPTASRWSLPRLSSIGRRDSSTSLLPSLLASPNVQDDARRASVASTFSNATYVEKPTPSVSAVPTFGGFSFAKLGHTTTADAADTLPTMSVAHRESFASDISDVSEGAPSLTHSSSCSDSSRSSSPTESPMLLSDELIQVCEETFGLGLSPTIVVDKARSDPASPTITIGVAC